jgi:hypothetical protein
MNVGIRMLLVNGDKLGTKTQANHGNIVLLVRHADSPR